MNSTSNVYVWRKKTKQKKPQKTQNWEYSYYVEDKKKEEKENGPISTAVKAK